MESKLKTISEIIEKLQKILLNISTIFQIFKINYDYKNLLIWVATLISLKYWTPIIANKTELKFFAIIWLFFFVKIKRLSFGVEKIICGEWVAIIIWLLYSVANFW